MILDGWVSEWDDGTRGLWTATKFALLASNRLENGLHYSEPSRRCAWLWQVIVRRQWRMVLGRQRDETEVGRRDISSRH
jgi:hypothetical protein